MKPALEQVVVEAYRVFSAPRPCGHQACTACCMTAENNRLFFQVGRADLPVTFFDDWYCAAFGGPASPELRRYLLPRVLELLCSGHGFGFGMELVLQRFETGQAELWTREENLAIEAFTAAFMDAQKPPDAFWGALDDVLCMFAIGQHDLDPLLTRIWHWSDADLIARLHRDWSTPLGGVSFWRSAFWDSDHPGLSAASQHVLEWYRNPLLLQRCFEVCLDPAQTDDIQTMAGHLYDGLRHA